MSGSDHGFSLAPGRIYFRALASVTLSRLALARWSEPIYHREQLMWAYPPVKFAKGLSLGHLGNLHHTAILGTRRARYARSQRPWGSPPRQRRPQVRADGDRRRSAQAAA